MQARLENPWYPDVFAPIVRHKSYEKFVGIILLRYLVAHPFLCNYMLLENFKSPYPHYEYYVGSNEPYEIKAQLYREFLTTFKQDSSFSSTSVELGRYMNGIHCAAISVSTEPTSRLYIALTIDKEENLRESALLNKVWVDALEISLNLEDKWNGTRYTVSKMLSREGKKSLLKQFVDKYQGSQFKVNPQYGGGTTFKVEAVTSALVRQELLIDYLPLLTTEPTELQQEFEAGV